MGFLLGSNTASSPAPASGGDIALFFTDLTSGPNTGSGTYSDGAFIRLYGKGFGATRGSGTVTLNGVEVASYESWGTDSISGLDMIVVQPGSSTSTGNFVVTNNAGDVSNGVAFTVDNNRNIREVDGNTELTTAVNAINTTNQDDIVYFRAGTYTVRVGTTSWGNDDFTFGPDWDDTAWIAYPGETVNVGDWRFNDGTGNCDNVTVAGMYATGGDDTFFSGVGGQASTSDEAGPVNQRIVGCDVTTTYTGNTMTGAVQFSGDGGRMLGCYCHDNGGTTVFNNNHSVYIQVGADDVEVAYNRFYNERLGHVIQVHTDGPLRQYDNIRIHSNLIQQGPNGDCRGTNVSGTTASSTIDIYNNVFDECGGGFSTHISYTGDTRFYNNTLVRCDGWPGDGLIRVVGGTCAIRNNIIWEQGSANAYIQNPVTLDANCYFGTGNGPAGDTNAVNADPDLVDTTNSDWSARDYRPNIDSIVRNRGFGDVSALSLSFDRVGNDRDGAVRSDIGAHQRVPTLYMTDFSGTVDQNYDRATVSLSGAAVNFGSGDFSWGCKIRPSSTASDNAGTGSAFWQSNLILDRDLVSGTGGEWAFGIDAGRAMWYQANSNAGGGSTRLVGSTDLRDGDVHTIMVCRNGTSGVVSLYVDGTREATATGTTSSLVYSSGGTTKDQLLEIGGEKAAQGTPSYTGGFGEFWIKDIVEETGASYTVPTTPIGVDSDTTAYYEWSEGSGTTVQNRVDFEDEITIVEGGSPTVPEWDLTDVYA